MGVEVGSKVGRAVGLALGVLVGVKVGSMVSISIIDVGDAEGSDDRASVCDVGAVVGGKETKEHPLVNVKAKLPLPQIFRRDRYVPDPIAFSMSTIQKLPSSTSVGDVMYAARLPSKPKHCDVVQSTK